jgi:hypothetical protein
MCRSFWSKSEDDHLARLLHVATITSLVTILAPHPAHRRYLTFTPGHGRRVANTGSVVPRQMEQ